MVNETFQLSWILLNFVNNWKFYAFHHLFKLNNMYSNRGTTDNSCTVCDASSGAGLLFLPLSAQIKQKQWACNLLLFFFFLSNLFRPELWSWNKIIHRTAAFWRRGAPRANWKGQFRSASCTFLLTTCNRSRRAVKLHTQIEETGSPEWTAILVHQEAKIFNILILLFFV